MRYDTSAFLAWQEAERLAAEAERKLFAKLSNCAGGEIPSQEEVVEARALRENASRRMQRMLDEMRELAALLKCSREKAGVPVTVIGFRTGQLTLDARPDTPPPEGRAP